MRWFVTFILLSLSACTTYPTQSDAPPPFDESSSKGGGPGYSLNQQEQSLYQSHDWTLSGRLSVKSEDGIWTGAIRWRQGEKDFVLNINAPLGQGALQLKGDDIGVALRTADGRELQADDVDSLFAEELGFELPVTGLRYWILGIPAQAKKASLKRNAQSAIVEIRQSDWHIAINRYQSVGDRLLPRKLVLNNREYRIRIIVDRWDIQFPPVPTDGQGMAARQVKGV